MFARLTTPLRTKNACDVYYLWDNVHHIHTLCGSPKATFKMTLPWLRSACSIASALFVKQWPESRIWISLHCTAKEHPERFCCLFLSNDFRGLRTLRCNLSYSSLRIQNLNSLPRLLPWCVVRILILIVAIRWFQLWWHWNVYPSSAFSSHFHFSSAFGDKTPHIWSPGTAAKARNPIIVLNFYRYPKTEIYKVWTMKVEGTPRGKVHGKYGKRKGKGEEVKTIQYRW